MNELTQPTSSVTPETISTPGGITPRARAGRGAGVSLLAWVVVATASLAPAAARGLAAGEAGSEGAAAPVPAALKARVVAAYGGAAALSRVVAVRQTGHVTAVAQGGKTGRLARLLALPESLRVEIAYQGDAGEIRVHHGGRGFRDGQEVTGTVPHDAMVLQAARIALPFWIAAGKRELRYTGPRERESRTLETIALSLGERLELTAEIDPASGRIVRTIGRIAAGSQTLEFVNSYSDFRTVHGIAFAHREDNFARGVHTGETILERIELLDAVPAGAFDAPAAPAEGSRL